MAFMPKLIDAFILPRVSIVIAGACVGTSLALLIPSRPGLASLRWPLLAAAGAALVAFAFSVSWPLSFVGGYTRYESLPVRLSYLGLLAVPVWLLRTERARTAVVAALVFGTTVSSLEALAQWWLSAPFRPDGNLGNANLLGALGAMTLPLTVARFLRLDGSMPLWLLAADVQIGGLLVSTSRGGALGALAGCLVLAAFAKRTRAAVVAWVGSGATIVGAALLILNTPALRNLNGDPGPTRVHLYQDALHMVAARPISGWGEDATGLVFGRFLSGDWSPGVTFDRAHSGLLDLMATQGILGMASLGIVMIVLLWGLWRSRFTPAQDAGLAVARAPRPERSSPLGPVSVGSIGAACVGYTLWVSLNFDWAPATGALWLLAGTGWSAALARNRRVEPQGGESPVSWSPARYVSRLAAAVGLVAVAILLGALPIVAEAWYSDGRPDLAIRVDPLQAQYHRALGEALIGEGSRADGLAELRLAARLGATDPALYVELGDEELRAGDVAQARQDYRMALTIDPYWAPAQQRLAANGGLGSA